MLMLRSENCDGTFEPPAPPRSTETSETIVSPCLNDSVRSCSIQDCISKKVSKNHPSRRRRSGSTGS